jgi:TolA-binding protein
MKAIIATGLIVTGLWTGPVGAANESPEARAHELEKRVEHLEERVRSLEQAIRPEPAARNRSAAHREQFLARIGQDRAAYSEADRAEIERLYQIANRSWSSPEARASLEALVEKYPAANRTGCALLYLGQMAEGEEKEAYLKRAIANHADCWYGDGVQVGAYARFHLANYYRHAGRDDEARQLFEEIRTSYPDAIDHKGRRITDLIGP